MKKEKLLTKVALLPLILITFLNVACAAATIKTWLISAERGSLVRYDGKGNVSEEKSLRDANNYRCYSPEDDKYWRTLFANAKACCDSK